MHIIGSGDLYDPSTDDSSSIRTGFPHPVAYTYEAAVHCPECAARRFGADEHGTIPESASDREGNGIGAIAPWDEMPEHWTNCDTCETLLR